MFDYTPEDWFWRVEQTGKIYSSAARTFVEALPDGRVATPVPTTADIWDALRRVGCLDGLPTDMAEAVILTRMQFDFMGEYLGLAEGLDAAVAAMPEATDEQRRTKIGAKVLLRSSQEFHRNHPMVAALAAALKLSDAQLDAAWLQAAQVTL